MAIQLGFLQIQGRNMAINMLSTMKKWLYNLIFYSKLAAQPNFLQLIGGEHTPPFWHILAPQPLMSLVSSE
jgi:hypothetical protein